MHLIHHWRVLQENHEVRNGFKMKFHNQKRLCVDCGKHQYWGGYDGHWVTDGYVSMQALQEVLLDWTRKGPMWQVV